MFSTARPTQQSYTGRTTNPGLLARFGSWCRTLVTPVPYKETAAYDLHITGKATFTQDRSALIIDVTSGTQYHLDVDCQCIASRPAVRNMYTVRFSPHQIEAIQTTPLFRDTLAHMESGPVNARLYVCDGRVEHATLVSHNGYEIEWVDFELIG